MSRPDVKVRLAQDSEAEIVASLVSEIFQMGDWELPFESVYPYWLVAEIAGEIVGAINIRLSMPISSVEMLSIDPKLGMRERGSVASVLTDSAMAICAAHGAAGVSSMIPDSMGEYLKVAERRGYVVGNHGSIIFGRAR
jgi:hypothetical protein